MQVSVYNKTNSLNQQNGGFSYRGGILPLHFGFKNSDLTEADLRPAKVENPALAGPYIALTLLSRSLFYLGGKVPKIPELRSVIFKADQELQRENDLLMENPQGLGAKLFRLPVQRPGIRKLPLNVIDSETAPLFQVHCGYVQSNDPAAGKPTVIFTLGANGAIKDVLPFLMQLKNNGYSLLLYQPALLDRGGNHLGTYNLSNKSFEQSLTDDLLLLSNQLKSGITTGKGDVIPETPYGNQVLIGYSMGAITTLNALATEPSKNYKGVMLVAPPESWSSATRHIKENEVFKGFAGILPAGVAAWTYKGFFDTAKISLPSSLNVPIAIAAAAKDGVAMRDPEKLYDYLNSQIVPQTNNPLVFAFIRGATHNDVVNKQGYMPESGLNGGIPGLTEEKQPYYRLAGVLDDLLHRPESLQEIDPVTNRYEGVVRFSGIG